MPTITINIAGAGHPRTNGSSYFGHMWITKPDGTTIGYAPGGPTPDDGKAYKPGYYTQDINLTDEQWGKMQDFFNNSEKEGFGKDDYNAATNACVDFAWKALEAAGINPKGYEGTLFPWQNIDELKRMLGLPVPEESPRRETALYEMILGLIGPASAYGATLDGQIQGCFQSAQAWVQPRYDPLAFDLDGDGLETTGIDTAKPTYFDHDGDGVKTATGWINSDDGLLVYDRNGNGSIDCGRELFGDSTTLAGGTTAADGFAALAGEDSNGDGRVDAADAHFAGLRIWRDINGDGISQADELLTLESLGIASISVAKSTDSTSLANGNSIAGLGSYTKTDGSTGIIGDINFRENTFLSRFAGAVPLTTEAETLPGMHGAGQPVNQPCRNPCHLRGGNQRRRPKIPARHPAQGLERYQPDGHHRHRRLFRPCQNRLWFGNCAQKPDHQQPDCTCCLNPVIVKKKQNINTPKSPIDPEKTDIKLFIACLSKGPDLNNEYFLLPAPLCCSTYFLYCVRGGSHHSTKLSSIL